MFKLPKKPESGADSSELADFMELLCWIHGQISRTYILNFLGIKDDNLDEDGEGYEGCEDADDGNGNRVDETLMEIEYRKDSCNGGYPYEFDDTGTILKLRLNIVRSDPSIIYFYLLAATRLNMKIDRRQANIDGTMAMEEVSAHALRTYLGERSISKVFGTSVGGSFKDKVNRLCKALKEPTAFENRDGDDVPVHAKDGKLDVVAWIPFADSSPSQLIVFAQSKTGTTWRDRASELWPDIFQNRWLRKPFLVKPIRAFCVSESIIQNKWNSTCIDTGLLLDRCRLVECCINLDKELKKKLDKWVSAAKTVITNYLTE